MKTKIFAGFLVILLLINMILMAFGRVNALVFWSIIIICALVAYKLLPRLKK